MANVFAWMAQSECSLDSPVLLLDSIMNRINPKKLYHSKWTAVKPQRKERHFLITEVEFDDESLIVVRCIIQAIMTKQDYPIDWQSLRDSTIWAQGWK